MNNCNAYLLNATDGNIYKQENDGGLISLTLESGEAAAVYLTERRLSTTDVISTDKSTVLSDFKMRRVNSFRFGHMTAINEAIHEQESPITLGCWADVVGGDFSGTCSYRASFSGVDSDAILDLGDVRHVSEVFLNGEPLGVKIMKPYRFRIKKELLRDENELEILVTNTVANQQHYSKTFDKWKLWQLTSYSLKQNEYDCDSLDSGLYGPVRILY